MFAYRNAIFYYPILLLHNFAYSIKMDAAAVILNHLNT